MSVEPQAIVTERHRALIGVETAPGYHLVEAGAVRRFCEAVGIDDPIYTDPEAARAAGYWERPVPPTFWCAIMAPGSELERPDFGDFGTRNLNGGTEFEYAKPAFVGQTYAATLRIADIYERQGQSGPMVFTVFETTWRDRTGDIVTQSRLIGVRA